MSQKVAIIEGMTCGHCENSVTESLTKLGNLTEIKVSSADGTARFAGEIDQAALAAAIDDAGYKLISVSDE
jgi:copper chaperone CopZ